MIFIVDCTLSQDGFEKSKPIVNVQSFCRETAHSMDTRQPDMTAQGAATSFQDTQDPNPKAHEDDTARHALLANLRHELRTMLNAILGFSEILLEDMKEAG